MRISDWSSDVCSSDLEREGKPLTIKIRRGAVLATGGFSQNPEMRKQHIPYAEHHISLMPPGNTGDGIRAAMEVEIGRASCRERVCQYVSLSVVAVSLKKKKKK